MGICTSSDKNEVLDKPQKGVPKIDHVKKELSDKKIENIDPQVLQCKADFLESHENEVLSVCYIDEGKIASVSRDNTVKIWDTTKKAEPQTLEGHTAIIYSITYLPLYDYLATGDAAGEIKIWSLEKMKLVMTIKSCHSNNGYSAALVSSRDNERLISGGSIEDPRVLIIDWKNINVEKALEGDKVRPTLLLKVLTEDLVASAHGEDIKVWNIKEGFMVQELKGHKEEITGFAGGANNQLISSSEDNTIKLWDYSTGIEKSTNNRHYAAVTGLAQVSDELLISTDADKVVVFWLLDPENNLTEVKSFNTDFEQGRNIKCIVRVDGKHFATTNGDKNIQLWK